MEMSDIKHMETIVDGINVVNDNNIKRIKSDKGLIERTESSKIILSEDNRQVLLG
jgi:hypothetical protein